MIVHVRTQLKNGTKQDSTTSDSKRNRQKKALNKKRKSKGIIQKEKGAYINDMLRSTEQDYSRDQKI